MSVPHGNNELQLLSLIAAGDEAAFRELFTLYRDRLYSFVFRFTKSAHITEELVQDVFLKCWTNRAALATVESANAYLFTMARNKSIDYLRKLAHETAMLEKVWKQIAAAQNSTEETFHMNEVRRLIDTSLAGVTAQKRTVFYLSRYEGLTHREIAARLQLSEGTVRNIMSEVLRHVRTYLEDYNVSLALAFAVIFNGL